jgi:hypothetical protein
VIVLPEGGRDHAKWPSGPPGFGRCTQYLWERACSRWRHYRQHHNRLTGPHREQARSHIKRTVHGCCSSPLIRPSVSSPSAFDLDLPRRKAERRFCVVGNPAWMPG